MLLEWANSEKSGTEVFKVNVNNGQARPEFKHSADFLGYVFDKEGDARVRSRANRNDNTVTLQFRTGIEGGWSDWTDWLTWDVDADRYVEVLAFESPDYNRAYVRWARDRDTQGIYLFDMKNPDAEPELLFAIDRYDAQDVVVACVSQECVDGDEDPPIVGFYYVGDGPSIYYVDEAAAALQASIDAALPAGNFNRIHDRAKEDKYIIIRSMGPQEPGRYYLLEDRSRLRLLGRASTIEPEQFGERKVIWYEARDGMKLNAVLTLPTHGEPPYPAIAHPHGGPRSRDSLHWNSSFWDEWPQLLATRGYAVLQPNYRGSTGFGFDYYSAGNKEWGYKMQDDVDDGMHYLVEQGIADPDRMAIFGWSYGGYSAMVGALRDPNIYRCAIPGRRGQQHGVDREGSMALPVPGRDPDMARRTVSAPPYGRGECARAAGARRSRPDCAYQAQRPVCPGTGKTRQALQVPETGGRRTHGRHPELPPLPGVLPHAAGFSGR